MSYLLRANSIRLLVTTKSRLSVHATEITTFNREYQHGNYTPCQRGVFHNFLEALIGVDKITYASHHISAFSGSRASKLPLLFWLNP